MDARPNNPLLDAPGLRDIAHWLSDTSLFIAALRYDPIAPIGHQAAPPSQRRVMVDDYRRIFVPTPDAIRIGSRILRMLLDSLQRRNPRFPQVQRWINSTQQWLDKPLDDIPWNPVQAYGMVVEGITGIGKSHIVDRVLHLLPQTVDHLPNGEWGMVKLRQLVWLKVHLPADHTRKGLLVATLTEMDRVLGSDYVKAHVRPSTSIEVLIVKVMHLLTQHRCGALVIEEAQVQNIGSPVFSRDFMTFFLRMLNWGVPVILVGNPLAFAILKSHAQDMDRFSEGGWFTLLPSTSPDRAWRELWIPGVWNPTLLEEADAPFAHVDRFPAAVDWPTLLWLLTGGLPRQLARLRAEVMDWCLAFGISHVTPNVVLDVIDRSPSFTAVQSRNHALAQKDLAALRGFEDLPLDQLRRHWAKDDAAVYERSQCTNQSQKDQPATLSRYSLKKSAIAHTSEAERLCDDLKRSTKQAQARKASRQTTSERGKDDGS